MLSHVHIGVDDFPRAFAFYSGLMEILGCPLQFAEPERNWAGWKPRSGGRPLLLIGKPFDGQPAVRGNGQMIALSAPDRATVDRCHRLALTNGGMDEGPPGLRPQYHPDYYGAYFRDPDGNKLCVCCHDPVVPVTIVPADAPTAEVAALIGELNAEMGALYTAEQQHGLALEAIFQPHIRFFLAWRGGEPVGCGGVGFFDGFAELKRMYVRPRARGQGVADALVARLEAESAAAGHDLLRLETGSRSLAAIRFYRRAGFHPCAAFPPYGSMPPAAIATSVFMEKRLSPFGALPP